MAARNEADKKRLDAKHQQILQELLKEPENKVCADCGEKGPRWASWDIGCFLCLRCAGIHRRMGTHISKVKSVTLDSWKEDQIESIRTKGNAVVNGKYNPNPGRHPPPPPGDDAAMEHYIRDKYERKLFMDSADRYERQYESRHPTSTSSHSSSATRGEYAAEMARLIDMGFIHTQLNLEALRRANGDVNGAVNILVRHQSGVSSPQPSTTSSSNAGSQPPAAAVTALMNMGFKNEEEVKRALRETHGDVPAAIQILAKSSSATSAAPASKPAQNNNLLGDDLFGSEPAKSTTASNGFGDFTTSSSSSSSGWGNSNDFFGSSAPSATTTQSSASNDLFKEFSTPAPAPAPKANTNDILSLFGTAPAQPAGPPPLGGAPAGGFGMNPYGAAPAANPFGAAPNPYGAAAANPFGAPQPGAFGAAPPAMGGFPAGGAPFGAAPPGMGAFGAPAAANNPFAPTPGAAMGGMGAMPGYGAAAPFGQMPPSGGMVGGYGQQPAGAANPFGAPANAGMFGTAPQPTPAAASNPFGAPAANNNPFKSAPASNTADAFSSLSWK